MPIAEIKLRRGTTVDWLLVDPVLDAGEPGYDLTTKRIKVGDGTTPWSGLLFQTVDPATLTEILRQVDESVATAEAAADTAADAAAAAQAVGNTNDTITVGLINNTSSATATALTAKYVNTDELVFNVKDSGVKADGTTDDSANIRTAISTATTAGGITYFPPGTYLVSEEGTTLGCLNLPSGARLAGPGKIIRHPSARDGVRPIQIDGKTDVRIDDLTVDMNGPGGVGAHCIQTKDSTHVYINRVKCLTGGRGGISIMGTAIHYRITECEIYSPVFNGITFYGSTAGGYPLAANDIVIDRCHIEAGVQPIDSEPVGGFAKNVHITNNYLESKDPNGNYAITMTAGYPDLNEKYVVTGNTCIGAITAFNCKDSVIADNTIDARGLSATATPYAVHAGYASSGMTVTGNKIWTGPDGVGIGLFYAATAGVGRPVDWIVNGNEIHVQGNGATTAIGIWCSSAGPVVVSNNIVRGVNGGIGIWVRGTTAGQPAEAATITGNDVDGFARGIYGHYLAEVVKALTITGNTVRQTTPTPTLTSGIELLGTSAQIPQVSISGNTVDSVYGTNAYKLSSVLVREGSSPGTWSGNGSPEGVVTAGIGALYKRRDGSTGTSLYVKESGTGNTGWVAHGSSVPLQITARQTADQTVNNSTTAVNVTDLALPVAANSKYRLTAFIIYSAAAAADVGASWAVPAGAALTWTNNAAPITATTANNTMARGINNTGTIGQLGSIVAGQKIVALPVGTLTTGATAGTLQFKFAQVAADPSDAVIHADSWITLEKVA